MESLPITYLRFVPSSPLGVQEAPPMSVGTYRSGNWLVLEVTGEIDVLSVPYLRPLLEEHPFVVLDLRWVGFIDCSGLRLLADRARSASGAGGGMRVAGASPWVRRLVGLAPFQGPMSMFDSVAEALSTPMATPRPAPGSDRD